MFGIVFDMMEGLQEAFVTENVEKALEALAQDDMLDKMNQAGGGGGGGGATAILVDHALKIRPMWHCVWPWAVLFANWSVRVTT